MKINCLRRFTSGNEPPYSLNRRMGGPKNESERLGEKSLCPAVIQTSDSPACSVVTIPTTLPWFLSGFGGLEVACWPLVPKFEGFALARSCRIFRAKKFSAGFPSEGKSVPCRSFTACKRSLNVTWKPAFRQNSRTFLAHSSIFCRWVLSLGDTCGDAWWRKLEHLTQIAQ